MPINYDIEYPELRKKYGLLLREKKKLEADNERLRKNLKKIRQCALPDPFDEREISLEWLIKIIMEQTNK